MSGRSPLKLNSVDKDRIQQARRQIIKCESVVRKVLAIHNCFEELRNLDNESDGSSINDSFNGNKSPLRKRMDDNSYYNIPQEGGEKMQQMLSPFKPAKSHIGTPLFNRTSPQSVTPIVSRVKPVSSHISTPTPLHGLSYISSSSRRSLSPIKNIDSELLGELSSPQLSSYQSPRIQRLSDLSLQYSETALHTPTKRHTRAADLHSYMITTDIMDDDDRHIQWIDSSERRPLVQGTPPPSRPLHRESLALKPCIDSPDIQTKEQLAKQRLSMLEKQRVNYLEQADRKRARLF